MREELQRLNDEWAELMFDGRFNEAWQISDRSLALRSDLDCSTWPRHQQFVWRGQSLIDKKVLVRCYHGLGDTIQFSRLLARLKSVARHVTVWVQPELLPLLARMDGVDSWIPLHEGTPGIEYDVDIELSELMHALRVEPRSLGQEVPYLLAEPIADAPPADRYRVGIVWASGESEAQRSVPCDLFTPLESIAGVEWIVLQRGPALEQWTHSFGRIPKIEDICEEARLMQSLDLVITVDTSSAHLAGALGVPVWTLLCHNADWRWMRGRADTPWYPSMRLVRQSQAGNWIDVLHEVFGSLSRVARAHTDLSLSLD